MRIIHCEYECECDKRPDAIYFFQAGHLWIMLLRDFVDLPAIFGNPLIETFYFRQQRLHHGLNRRIQPCCQLQSNLFCAALSQSLPEGLRQPTSGIHKQRPCPHQDVTCSDDRQVSLRFWVPMTYWTEKTGINPYQSSQGASVQAIILSRALADQLNLPGIGNDDFMSQLN